MFRHTILDIFSNVWPMILIFTTILISIRITWVLVNHEKFVFYEEVLKLGFVIYIMCLFSVVTFQDVGWSTSNFVPFREMFRYELGSRLFFKNVLGNLIMLLPYGFFLTYFLKLKKPYLVLLLTFIASMTIELTQLVIGRVFDIDDIILNLFGAWCGFMLYRFLAYFHAHWPITLKKDIFYNIIVILVIALGVFYLMQVMNGGL